MGEGASGAGQRPLVTVEAAGAALDSGYHPLVEASGWKRFFSSAEAMSGGEGLVGE